MGSNGIWGDILLGKIGSTWTWGVRTFNIPKEAQPNLHFVDITAHPISQFKRILPKLKILQHSNNIQKMNMQY
ncbi:hypothetical protein QQP08_007153 [Theobroma cacao]|nr:hypothetical protein QQP08_007153 [Theobroma cacao]